MIVVTSSHALRSHWRGTGRPMNGCGTSTTSSSATPADAGHDAAAPGRGSAVDPEGVHRFNTTQRCGTPLWSHTGGAATSSLPCASGCEAQPAVLFSPPRDGSSIPGDLCNLLR